MVFLSRVGDIHSYYINDFYFVNELPKLFDEDKVEICRGRYRISQKGGRGLSQVWIFHTWIFCSRTYHAVHGQNVGGQNIGGQNASQNCKGTKCWPFYWTGRVKCQSYQNTLYMILMVK